MDQAASTTVGRQTNRWSIEPERFLSRHFELYQENELITTLRMCFWREGCEFSIAGHAFTIVRKSLWKDGFLLMASSETFCDVKRAFLSRRFELSSSVNTWVLQRAGWFSRTFLLLQGERQVGAIKPAGWFMRKRSAQFAEAVPPPIQVLAVFLVLIVAQRGQRNSAG